MRSMKRYIDHAGFETNCDNKTGPILLEPNYFP